MREFSIRRFKQGKKRESTVLVPLTPFVLKLLRNPLLRYLIVFFVGLKTNEVSVLAHKSATAAKAKRFFMAFWFLS